MKSSAAIKHPQPDFMKDNGESDAGETPLGNTGLEPDRISAQQFCALEYVPELKPGAQRTIKHVILVVVRQADGVLQFLAHPNLREVVEVTKLSQVMSLFEELLACAKCQAEQLFRQLCSQASGPLLPWKVGEQIDDHPDIRDLAMQFMPL